MSGQYQDFPEILSVQQLAKLFCVSKETAYSWFRTNEFPFGKIKLGVHYFKSGKELRIVKDRFCQMAGILPKSKEV
jgi:predicted DNA-binding transcriptional regulator AlpA